VVVIVTFLVVAGIASPLLGLLQTLTHLDPSVLRLTQFSTAVGALIVWGIWRKSLRFPPISKKGIVTPLIVAVGLSIGMVLVLHLLQTLESRTWPIIDPSTLAAPLIVTIGVQLVGAAGEEVGWRGIVQPLLETRMAPIWAAIITGLLFGVGHFYVLGAGLLVFIVFVISAVGLSLALAATTLRRSVGERIAIASVFHWLVNMALLIGFSNGDQTLLWIANTAIATCLIGGICVPFILRAQGTRLRERSSDSRDHSV
jgi:membrane protease YdiL (CAAX protease family)